MLNPFFSLGVMASESTGSGSNSGVGSNVTATGVGLGVNDISGGAGDVGTGDTDDGDGSGMEDVSCSELDDTGRESDSGSGTGDVNTGACSGMEDGSGSIVDASTGTVCAEEVVVTSGTAGGIESDVWTVVTFAPDKIDCVGFVSTSVPIMAGSASCLWTESNAGEGAWTSEVVFALDNPVKNGESVGDDVLGL